MFTSGGFGRLLAQVGIAQHFFQQRPNHFAGRRDSRAAIVGRAAFRDSFYQRVNNHIAGAGVERNHILRPRIRRNYGHIGDPTDVQSHAPDFRVAVQQVIDERHQRCSVTARRHIGWAKIGNRRNPGAFRDDAGFSNLQRR